MFTPKFHQHDSQAKTSLNTSGDIPMMQSIQSNGTRQRHSWVMGLAGAIVLLISLIAGTIWLDARVFAHNQKPTITGDGLQPTAIIANYCNALVKHDFSQAESYILPHSLSLPNLLQEEVADAEQQNKAPLVGCKIFASQDTTYATGKKYFVNNDGTGNRYALNNDANWYLAKEVVSFHINFFFQKPNALTTYLTGQCDVLPTATHSWRIYDTCYINACPIPGWRAAWGHGPACPGPRVVKPTVGA